MTWPPTNMPWVDTLDLRIHKWRKVTLNLNAEFGETKKASMELVNHEL